MLTQQRHEIILELLREKGSITVTEVKDLLDTSESTVRRQARESLRRCRRTEGAGNCI